jgi:hypothetical protein
MHSFDSIQFLERVIPFKIEKSDPRVNTHRPLSGTELASLVHNNPKSSSLF